MKTPSRVQKINGLPLVTDATRAQSESVETILGRMRSNRVYIPNYQRDAEQWDRRKESLFIESLLNNLTIPAFFFSEQDDGRIEVVDGQQRLTTIKAFVDNEFALSSDDAVVYLTPQSVHYKGKKCEQLPAQLRDILTDYPLTIIYLPRAMNLTTKLEVFRRINEGGTPLTAQDIRLAYYSESRSVFFIRLAGVYAKTPSTERMLQAGESMDVADPWAEYGDAWQYWQEWWDGKVKAKGQTPSEMFLWFLVTKYAEELRNLLDGATAHLRIGFRGTTEESLDVFCAQLHHTDLNGGVSVFTGIERGLEDDFETFAGWIEAILGRGLAGISVDKYKQMALFIGAAAKLEVEPEGLSDGAWDAIGEFITTPRSAGTKWLKGGYPEQKGRWSGTKGQYAQCTKAVEILQAILKKRK